MSHIAAPPFAVPQHAWVRAPSDAYADCIRTGSEPIDVALAKRQHAGYVRALEAAGVAVRHIAPDAEAPDCCFIEDTAVIWDGGGISSRMAAASRAPEAAVVGAALREAGLALEVMQAPATLDGGDVLRVGEHLVVGRSERTNPAGVEALAAAAPHLRVVSVEVRAGLHLKSAVTLLDPTTLLAHGDGIDLGFAHELGLSVVTLDEAPGANVLALGRTILVSADAPRTAARIGTLGYQVSPVALSELHKGDGALTCLSLRLPPTGAWCC